MNSPWVKGPADRRRPSSALAQTALLSLILVVVYPGLAALALAMGLSDRCATGQGFFSEGVALAFVIIFGARVWPGILVGQFLLARWLGLSPGPCAVLAAVAGLQSLLGGYFFWHWRISPALHRPRDIAMLFALSALVVQPFNAVGAAVAHYLQVGALGDRVLALWFYSWVGNTLGQFIILPLLLSWMSCPASRRGPHEVRRALLVIGIYFILVAVSVFGDLGQDAPLFRLLLFASFALPLVWIAAQSSISTTALANLLMAVPFLFLISRGPDFLLFFSSRDRHSCADIFILGAIVIALLVSALWEQLMDRKRQLREANAAKEKLFSVIGHDLRGPIGNLKSSLDHLVDSPETLEELRDFMIDMRAGVNHVHETLKNMVEWGGFQMDSLRPRFADVALRGTAAEAVQLLAPMAREKKITVENAIPPEAMVRADSHQLQSVMRNLLSNALKFTPELGQVRFAAEQVGGLWHVSVRDNGIGMSPEQSARLFKTDSEFTSTPGTANERGLGLGLQLCLDFIRANHGRIYVESRPGSGTVFHFTIPSVPLRSP